MEFEVPAFQNVERGAPATDYLYGAASIDAIWNGAWGLLRAYDIEPGGGDAVFDMSKVLGDVDGCRSKYDEAMGAPGQIDVAPECALGDRLERLDNVVAGGEQGVPDFQDDSLTLNRACPNDAPVRLFVVDAWRVQDWLGGAGRRGFLLYNRMRSIADWNAAAFFKIHEELLQDANGDPVTAGSFTGGVTADAQMFRAWRGEAADRARRALREAHLEAYPATDPVEPMVLRARAGECVAIMLHNKLPGGDGAEAADRLAADPHAAGLPPITSMKAGDVSPSNAISLAPQVLHAAVSLHAPRIGVNREATSVPAGAYGLFAWYAGTIDMKRESDTVFVADPKPEPFGPINLVSWGDQVMHGVRGLVGALIIEPADAAISYPVEGSELTALIETGGRTIREFVVVAQDGLSLMHNSAASDWVPQAIPDCLVCDDSYDLGEKGANYRSYPFWSLYGLNAGRDPTEMYDADEHPNGLIGPERNLNAVEFPPRFMKGPGAWPGEPFRAEEGETVWVRVLQPAGRARQRAFLLYGHDYDEQLGERWDTSYHVSPRDWAESRSPHSALIGAGKTFTAEIESARKGTWIWRDGPNHIWAGGAWGELRVEEAQSD
jgi:hypothetical protein